MPKTGIRQIDECLDILDKAGQQIETRIGSLVDWLKEGHTTGDAVMDFLIIENALEPKVDAQEKVKKIDELIKSMEEGGIADTRDYATRISALKQKRDLLEREGREEYDVGILDVLYDKISKVSAERAFLEKHRGEYVMLKDRYDITWGTLTKKGNVLLVETYDKKRRLAINTDGEHFTYLPKDSNMSDETMDKIAFDKPLTQTEQKSLYKGKTVTKKGNLEYREGFEVCQDDDMLEFYKRMAHMPSLEAHTHCF